MILSIFPLMLYLIIVDHSPAHQTESNAF